MRINIPFLTYWTGILTGVVLLTFIITEFDLIIIILGILLLGLNIVMLSMIQDKKQELTQKLKDEVGK